MRDLTTSLAQRHPQLRAYQRGRVTAVSGTLLTLLVDDGADPVTVRALTGTYAVNDVVMLARDGSATFVVGKLGTAPAVNPEAPETAPPPVKQVTKRTATILPTSTGSWRSSTGWRSGDEMRQGDWNSGYGINTGAAFYGRQLRSLGADLTKPRSAVLSYYRTDGGVFGAQTPTLWTLAQSSRPSGGPTRQSSTAATAVAVGRAASFALPESMLDALLSGSSGGLGIYVGSSSPYIVLSGRSDYAKAFALAVTYYA